MVCNNTEQPIEVELPLCDIGVPDGAVIFTRFSSRGHVSGASVAGIVAEGCLRCFAPANSAVMLAPSPGKEAMKKYTSQQKDK